MSSAGVRLLAIFLVAQPLGAWAHGPTPRRMTGEIDIHASPEKVWALAGNFADMAAWHPLVTACSADKGNAVDSQRDVKLAGGVELMDSMDEYDAAHMSYSYRLMNSPGPGFAVSFYSATLTVSRAPDGSHVSWTGNFYRADTHNVPAAGQDDEAAEHAMREFLSAGLQGLKRAAER